MSRYLAREKIARLMSRVLHVQAVLRMRIDSKIGKQEVLMN